VGNKGYGIETIHFPAKKKPVKKKKRVEVKTVRIHEKTILFWLWVGVQLVVPKRAERKGLTRVSKMRKKTEGEKREKGGLVHVVFGVRTNLNSMEKGRSTKKAYRGKKKKRGETHDTHCFVVIREQNSGERGVGAKKVLACGRLEKNKESGIR